MSTNIFLSILSGIMLILIFPDFNLSFLAWIALVPLMIALKNKSIKTSFGLGFLTGFIFFSGVLYWIRNTLSLYGNLPFWLSIGILFLLSGYLAGYVGLFSSIIAYVRLNDKLYTYPLLLTPCVWVLLEFIRTYMISGFPWALLGYSQWHYPFLIQTAEFTGVYGISFLIILVNVTVFTVIESILTRNRQKLFVLIPTTIVVLIYIGYSVLSFSLENKSAQPKTLKIAVIQANISDDIKWQDDSKKTIIDKYIALSTKVIKENKPDLVIWPETAIPDYLKYEYKLSRTIGMFARRNNTDLLVGGPDMHINKYYNAAFLISSNGEISGQYYKIHLLPFGEMFPFRGLLSKIATVINEMGDYTPGKEFTVFDTSHGKYSSYICFESLFGNLVRKFVLNDAQMLVNITEDIWFGKSSAPQQHFSVNVFRAIENRRSIARAANTGISGFIDPYGRIISKTSIFREDSLVADVPLQSKLTFYTRFGDIFSWLCAMVTIAGIYRARRRRKKNDRRS